MPSGQFAPQHARLNLLRQSQHRFLLYLSLPSAILISNRNFNFRGTRLLRFLFLCLLAFSTRNSPRFRDLPQPPPNPHHRRPRKPRRGRFQSRWFARHRLHRFFNSRRNPARGPGTAWRHLRSGSRHLQQHKSSIETVRRSIPTRTGGRTSSVDTAAPSREAPSPCLEMAMARSAHPSSPLYRRQLVAIFTRRFIHRWTRVLMGPPGGRMRQV